MNTLFAETLRKLRKEKGLSQLELGKRIFVNHSTIARWEKGSRLPDVEMIRSLAEILEVDVSTLLSAMAANDELPNVIVVDDNRVILSDSISVLEEVLPNTVIKAFTKPQEAIDFAKENNVALAVLDIELGTLSGLDLCRTLLKINPRTNVIYLTAYPDYALDAWDTEASGFMVKPLTPEGVRIQLDKLKYPLFRGTQV